MLGKTIWGNENLWHNAIFENYHNEKAKAMRHIFFCLNMTNEKYVFR